VAIDQTPTPLTSPPDSAAIPAIENEFPTYRAISSLAVFSLVFGLGSVFCYASLWFLLLSAGSVILGIMSIRKIRQLPEVLTGAGIAGFGIGVGLLFGLTALSHMVAQDFSINMDAGEFAKRYVDIIKEKPVSLALWYQQSPEYRKQNNPDQLVEELKKRPTQMSGDSYQSNAAPIVAIKERLDGGKGGEMSYSQIESKAIDGLTTYANALIKLDLKGTKEHPEKEAYALFRMVKGADDWIVKEVNFPYTPRSAVATVEKKDDDGHGH
jgi:hypothetical protein